MSVITDLIDENSSCHARIAELEARIVWLECELQVNASPVSEAKAQGVVMPDVNAAAKALCNRHAMICGVDADDQWKEYSQDFIADAETVLANARLNAAPVSAGDDEFCDGNCTWLDHHPSCARAAAPAAPAADAWIQVSERLPDVPDGDEREVIVCVKRAHNGQSYSFSARYLNNFPLHSDSEDEPTFVTGWHDVKEHADYDGWYSTLIDKQSGDEVTHWMPLPAAHRAKGVV